MARAAAIDENAWIGSAGAVAPLRALAAPRVAASSHGASFSLPSRQSRSFLTIAATASLAAHIGILLAIALDTGPTPPTGDPNAIAVEFVIADAAAASPASAPSAPSTSEPSNEGKTAQAPPPPAAQSQASQDAPPPAITGETAPVSVAPPTSPDAPAPQDVKPSATTTAAVSPAPTPAASLIAPPPSLTAKEAPDVIARPPPDEAKPDAPPALALPEAPESMPLPASEAAPPAALAAKEEPVVVAPSPFSGAADAAPLAPRPIAMPAKVVAQLPAARPKPPAPKLAPKPAPSVAAARGKARPRAAAAAPTGSAPSRGVADVAAYRNALLAKISNAVRYPEAARARGASGVAAVNFALDAGGGVTSAQLIRSSGDGELDAEAVAAVRRASPLPAPPAEAPRAYIAPIRFDLR